MNRPTAADKGLSTGRSIAILALLVLAAGLFAASPLHGPVLFFVSPGHGFDLGDTAAFAAVVGAARLARPRLRCLRGPWRVLTDSRAALAGLGVALSASVLLYGAGVAQRLGTVYDAGAPVAFVAIVGWAIAAAVVDPLPWPETLPATVAAMGAALGVGLLVDAAMTPSGTLFGTTAAAVVLAIRARRPLGRAVFATMAVGMTALNAASLGDIAGVDVEMSRSGGGAARSAALAALLVTATAYDAVAATRGRP